MLGKATSIAARLNQLFLNLAKSQKIKAMILMTKNGKNARPSEIYRVCAIEVGFYPFQALYSSYD